MLLQSIRFLCCACLIAGEVVICGFALADETLPESDFKLPQLGDSSQEVISIEVVASPIIEGNVVDRYAGQQTVVSQEQIKDLNAQDLATAVRQAPGVTISRFNQVGSFGGGDGGGIFIRGMGSSRPGAENQTLIDGVPVYNSVWNHPLLDVLPIDPAESIEIYKGPQPSHFGNAFSAINLVPKKIKDDGFHTEIFGAGDTIPSAYQSFEHGGKVDAFDYYLGQGVRTSKGHRESSHGTLTNYFARLGYQFSENWDLSLFSLFADNYSKDPGQAGLPETKQGKYETDIWLNIATLAHAHNVAEGSIKLYWNAGHGDWFDQSGEDDDTLNTWDLYGVRAREAIELWQGGELLGGIDLDYIAGNTDFSFDDGSAKSFDSPTFRITSPYMAFSQRFASTTGVHFIPSVGVRYYNHSNFDEEWAPHAGVVLGYKDTELHAAYARGISYPGLNVVVFSENILPPLADSWKDLGAEKADHFEIGIRHTFNEIISVDTTYFHQEGKDRYVILPPPPFPPSFVNLEEFTIDGVETSMQIHATESISLFGGITWLDTDPGDIPYAPEWTLPMGANFQLSEALRLTIDAKYVDDYRTSPQLRSAVATNSQSVDSFFLLNGKIAYLLDEKRDGIVGEVFLAAENLTDTSYEYQVGYPMPGISGSMGVRLVF